MSMANYGDSLRQCLLDMDVETMCKLWKHIAPHMPQPESDEAAIISMHYSRTQIANFPFRKRAYSHAWLTERGFPSGLPDRLRPRAERMYPRIAEAVGVAVLSAASANPDRRALGLMLRDTMSNVVMDHYDVKASPDPLLVRKDMARVRADFWRRLLGRATLGWRG